ncbi:hypothetical protein GCM10009592_14860 [Brachybacterium rhamnosum]
MHEEPLGKGVGTDAPSGGRSLSLARDSPLRLGENSPSWTGVHSSGSRDHFQNMSMPPPVSITPKPTARFQSPIGRGSVAEDR